MDRTVLTLVAVAIVVAVALIAQKRGGRPRPVSPRDTLPSILEWSSVAPATSTTHKWLVAVFTEATCESCASVVSKARVLSSDEVIVSEVEFNEQRAVHERYAIDSVPTTLVSDRSGAVRASFLGPVSAADLWATMAELREPGSVPPGCDHGAGDS